MILTKSLQMFKLYLINIYVYRFETTGLTSTLLSVHNCIDVIKTVFLLNDEILIGNTYFCNYLCKYLTKKARCLFESISTLSKFTFNFDYIIIYV